MSERVYPKTFEEAGIELPRHAGGENVKTFCPQCRHSRRHEHRNNKPLWVHPERGVWKCHNCGWTGRLDTGDQDWKHARVNRRVYDMPEPPAPNIEHQISPRGMRWLEGRKIDPALAAEHGWLTGYEYTDRETGERKTYGDNVLTIPYRNMAGEVVHVKHRALNSKKFWSSANTELVFWNLDQVTPDEPLYITEGEMDAMALIQSGVFNVVSVPNGTQGGATAKLEYLEAAEDLIKACSRIIIAVDADEPGQRLADELVRRIGGEKCWRVTWPDGCKDANDVLMRDGVRMVAAVVDRAVPVPVIGIYTGHDLEPSIIRLYHDGFDSGVDFGYPDFDKHYRVKQGYVTVVTGLPMHGKSTALDQLLIRLAIRHNWTFAIFSPEQQPLEWHQTQLIEQRVGMPFWDGQTERMSEETMLDANHWVGDRFAFLLPENPTIDKILELADTQILRTGVQGIVIDPWNEIEHHRPPGLSETEYISEALGKIRNFARNRNVHIWLVAHPTKMRPSKDGDPEPVPELYDISGSANFRNKADFGLTVWRDLRTVNSPVRIYITKSRRREIARLGVVEFDYDPATKRLDEIGVMDREP